MTIVVVVVFFFIYFKREENIYYKWIKKMLLPVSGYRVHLTRLQKEAHNLSVTYKTYIRQR